MMEHEKFNDNKKKVWILAGEESGDIYGGKLAKELSNLDPDLIIQGMGGRVMKSSNVDILVDSSELGVVGLVEVLKNFPEFLRIFNYLAKKAINDRPDAVILIDYPGFNLRFANKIKNRGIKIIYYISPQVWAWGSRRIPKMAKLINKMLVIFPFEKEIFEQADLPTVFVGHPLVTIIEEKIDPSIKRESDLILLLPGSRSSEINRILEPMVLAANQLHQQNNSFKFVISVPRPAIESRVNQLLEQLNEKIDRTLSITVDHGKTEFWMQKAAVGIAASGTVTVQSAIMGLPLIVIYRVNPITYWLGKKLINVDYITMVNIIAKAEVFQEYVQDDADSENITTAIKKILPGGERRDYVIEEMQRVVNKLKGLTDASKNAAIAIINELNDGYKINEFRT